MPEARQSPLVPNNPDFWGQLTGAQSCSLSSPSLPSNSALPGSTNLTGLSKAPLAAQLSHRQGAVNTNTTLWLPWATHLLAHIVVGQVDNRVKPLQHVKDHLSVTALSQGEGERSPCSEEGVGLEPPREMRGEGTGTVVPGRAPLC